MLNYLVNKYEKQSKIIVFSIETLKENIARKMQVILPENIENVFFVLSHKHKPAKYESDFYTKGFVPQTKKKLCSCMGVSLIFNLICILCCYSGNKNTLSHA